MMAFVVDASVTLPWFLEDERSAFTESVFASLETGEYWTPAIWSLEFPNALLAAEKKRRIDRATRLGVLDRAVRLSIRVEAQIPDMRTVSTLAERHGLSTYDAAYLELPDGRRLVLVIFTTGHARERALVPAIAKRLLNAEPSGRRE